jgi:hypothetical protein
VADLDDEATPPLELLKYLKDQKKICAKLVPYVELATIAVPDWST